jgi:hypothetical protein
MVRANGGGFSARPPETGLVDELSGDIDPTYDSLDLARAVRLPIRALEP